MKDITFSKTSHKIPIDFFIIRLNINNLMDVGLSTPNPNYLYATKNIKLILASKSYKALEKLKDPMIHGIVNAMGSSFFSTNSREATTLK